MDNKDIIYNSQDEAYKNPFGAVECETKININIRISSRLDCKSITLRTWNEKKGEKLFYMMFTGDIDEDLAQYSVDIDAPIETGLLWYYFIIYCENKVYFYGNNSEHTGGVGDVYDFPPDSYQITIYKRGFETPDFTMEMKTEA
jgi:4-alpha-glucanotransferase